MTKLRTGLVGCGSMGGGVHAPGLASHPQIELSAIADVTPPNLGRVGDEQGIRDDRRFGDAEDLVALPDLDLVVVATPPWLRKAPVLAALDSGKHVLAEKPLAAVPRDAWEMVEAAERGDDTESLHLGHVHLAESPKVMVAPMLVLAVLAVVIGFVANPIVEIDIVPIHWFTHFMGYGPVEVHIPDFDVLLAVVSTVVALAGIAIAYMMYSRRSLSPLDQWGSVGARFGPIYRLLSAKYYIDELYEGLIVKRAFYGGVALALDWADKNVVDWVVNKIGWFGANIGVPLRQIQTGQIQQYAAAISIGIIVILGLYLWLL